MTLLATYTQQPADRLDYDVYYANDPDGADDWLEVNDFLVGVTVGVYPTGLLVTHLMSANRIKLLVSGGEGGATYKVTLTVTTNTGLIKQDELKYRIKDL